MRPVALEVVRQANDSAGTSHRALGERGAGEDGRGRGRREAAGRAGHRPPRPLPEDALPSGQMEFKWRGCLGAAMQAEQGGVM